MNFEAYRIANDPLTQELLIKEPEQNGFPIAQWSIPEYITIDQAVIVAEVEDEEWICNLIKTGKIRYSKTVEGDYLVETISLLDFLEQFDKACMAENMRDRLDCLAGLNHVQ